MLTIRLICEHPFGFPKKLEKNLKNIESRWESTNYHGAQNSGAIFWGFLMSADRRHQHKQVVGYICRYPRGFYFLRTISMKKNTTLTIHTKWEKRMNRYKKKYWQQYWQVSVEFLVCIKMWNPSPHDSTTSLVCKQLSNETSQILLFDLHLEILHLSRVETGYFGWAQLVNSPN